MTSFITVYNKTMIILLYVQYCMAITVLDLLDKLEEAIENHRRGNIIPPLEAHQRIAAMYTWPNVARRTEQVYDLVHTLPYRPLHARIKRY